MGEIWKLGNGGVEKGFVIWFRDIFLFKLVFIMLGWVKVVGRFFENFGECCLKKFILVLSLKVCNKIEIKILLGWLVKVILSLFIFIGVGSDLVNLWFVVVWGIIRFGGVVDFFISFSIGFLVMIFDIVFFVVFFIVVLFWVFVIIFIIDVLVFVLVFIIDIDFVVLVVNVLDVFFWGIVLGFIIEKRIFFF